MAGMGSFLFVHWLVIAFVVALLFGNRLPNVMRSLAEDVGFDFPRDILWWRPLFIALIVLGFVIALLRILNK
jgi:hypothetical protein